MDTNISPVILTALDLEVHYGQQIILNKASISIHEGDRIGLVGRNGAGKSTFLKIISGMMEADGGKIAKKKELSIGFLTQDFTLDNSKNVYDNVLDGAENILELINEYEELPYDSPKRNELEDKIKLVDGWSIENKIKHLLKSLNAPDPDIDLENLSGGEKRRVALCRAIVGQPELLILDEPTNHLDTESIEWIEKFLSSYDGTCIFVTHDRYFLDRISNKIVELTNGEFISHEGNYTEYLINKAERLALKEVEEKKRQSFLKRELKWVVRGSKARRTKAKSRLDKYYEVANQKDLEVELDVDMIVPPAERLGNIILEMKGIGISFGNNKIIESLNFIFTPGRKLGIVGKNGVGKTTLLKIIIGEIQPSKGELKVGGKTNFNYLDQSRLLLNDNASVFDSVGDGNNFVKFGKEQLTVWSYLKRFLFTDDRINTLVGRLSGGERSRLSLARIFKNGGNFLVLDEPTNDLDLPTLRILEETLIAFNGCMVIVSHDRYLLNRVCNGIISFEGNGKVYFSEGNYDYYLEKRKSREKALKSSTIKIINTVPIIKPKEKRLTWKEKKELETIEEKIILAEENVNRIEAIFSSPDFHEKYAEKTNDLKKELEDAQENVKYLYEKWEKLEALNNN